MSVSFSVKNIPEALAERLRVRAECNHRSLQGELLAILEAAANEVLPTRVESGQNSGQNRGSRSVEDTLQRLRTLFPTPAQGVVSSTSLIRQMRDGRYGDAWAATGEQKEAD